MPTAPRAIFLLHVFLTVIAAIVCTLYIISGATAGGQKTLLPFHFTTDNIHLDRILPPAFLFIMYLFMCIPSPKTETKGPGLKGVIQQIGIYFRFAQVKAKTSKHVRPCILVFLALDVAFTSFVIIEELAIYNYLGSVATTILPNAVCAHQDALCIVYKTSAWTGVVLAAVVVVEVVITSKNRDALIEDEKMRRSSRPSSYDWST